MIIFWCIQECHYGGQVIISTDNIGGGSNAVLLIGRYFWFIIRKLELNGIFFGITHQLFEKLVKKNIMRYWPSSIVVSVVVMVI